MDKLLTIDQFILYLDELQKNQTLRQKFKSRYLFYGVKDISLLPTSNDFHVMWKLCLEYIEFIKTPLTYTMFEGENQIFTGLIQKLGGEPQSTYCEVNGKIIFIKNSEGVVIDLSYTIEDIMQLSVLLCAPLYSDAGVLIDMLQFNQ